MQECGRWAEGGVVNNLLLGSGAAAAGMAPTRPLKVWHPTGMAEMGSRRSALGNRLRGRPGSPARSRWWRRQLGNLVG